MSLELLDTQVAMSSSLNSQYGRIVADETLRDVWGLANDAAAVALGSERPQRAVELLEQGRGIVFAHLFRCRTALDDLQAASPRLAAEFATLSTRLEDSVKQDHTSTSGIDAGRGICGGDATGRYDRQPTINDQSFMKLYNRHHNLTLQLNGAVREIRMLPGFATFLKPTPFDTLRRAADEGPVIIVNVSEIRSDAIILLNDREPEIVRLTEITPAEVGGMYLCLRNAVQEPDARQRHRGVDEVLGLLWKSVVQHVVERLEKMGVPRGSRIWWCPTSWLCSLPLHAAGIYRPKQRKLPDMFISSHTTTLSALIRARKRDSNFKGQPSVLAVGVSQPEGRDGADGILPCVGEELRRLEKYFPSAVVIEDKDASHARVTEHLPAHSWVHLSCHGHQDVRQPFQSRFRLQDKPLSIQQIMCINLPNAELAYLSACHTATGDFRAPDEGLHLAAAMQFAGFRGVVGTLWAMDDIDGPDVAETFYAFMFRDGAEAVSHKDAAKGVWKISKALREKNVPLDRWANFIHVGA
ncbi:hypothetical protein FRB97_004985 [Tulasnella sp. 331]|nr:hypothetical protein FRB97_004985 [Tulasnella sp. 331]